MRCVVLKVRIGLRCMQSYGIMLFAKNFNKTAIESITKNINKNKFIQRTWVARGSRVIPIYGVFPGVALRGTIQFC